MRDSAIDTVIVVFSLVFAVLALAVNVLGILIKNGVIQ
jgi:hypothetical protein